MSYLHNTATNTAVTTIEAWAEQYKEQSIELHNSRGMFDLASPDDSILVAGPARFATALTTQGAETQTNSGYYVIGVCQQIQVQEQSNVQPVKSIGTRRMMFTKSNAPVSISIGRMMFYGKNLISALYTQVTDSFMSAASSATVSHKYAQGTNTAVSPSKFLLNLEEDMYRTPFGLGIIYHTPRTAAGASGADSWNTAVGAEYAECCYLVSRQTSIQSGQTTIMENVQILADRMIPWDTYRQTDTDAGVAIPGVTDI